LTAAQTAPVVHFNGMDVAEALLLERGDDGAGRQRAGGAVAVVVGQQHRRSAGLDHGDQGKARHARRDDLRSWWRAALTDRAARGPAESDQVRLAGASATGQPRTATVWRRNIRWRIGAAAGA
jgi:hypothetical protein